MLVYIREAHAHNVWPIASARFCRDGQAVIVNEPTTLEARCALARRFTREYLVDDAPISVVVDGVNDAFLSAFSAWPLRFYVVCPLRKRVLFRARPNNCSYDIESLRDWLLRHATQT